MAKFNTNRVLIIVLHDICIVLYKISNLICKNNKTTKQNVVGYEKL